MRTQFQDHFKSLLPLEDESLTGDNTPVGLQIDHWSTNGEDYLGVLYKTIEKDLSATIKPVLFSTTTNKKSQTVANDILKLCPAGLNIDFCFDSTSDNANNMIAVGTSEGGYHFDKVYCMEHAVALLENDIFELNATCSIHLEEIKGDRLFDHFVLKTTGPCRVVLD